MVKGTPRQQVWADPDFVRWINELTLKKRLQMVETKSKDKVSVPMITKEILKTNAIKDIEKELLKQELKGDIKVRLDFRRII